MMPENITDNSQFLPPQEMAEAMSSDPAQLLDAEAERLREIASAVSLYLGELTVTKESRAAARTNASRIGEMVVTLASMRQELETFAARKPAETKELTAPAPASPEPEVLSPEEQYAATIDAIIHKYERNDEISIGKVAFTLGNGTKLSNVEFLNLQNHLNAHKGLHYNRGTGIYSILPAADRDTTVPEVSASIPVYVSVSAVPTSSTMSAQLIEKLPVVLVADAETVEPTAAEPTATTSEQNAKNITSPEDAKAALLLRRAIHYTSKGYAFGIDELKADPEIVAGLTKQEISKLHYKLNALRNQVLEHIQKLGGNGRWILQETAGSKKYVFAFYAEGRDLLAIQKQMAEDTTSELTPQSETTPETPAIVVAPIAPMTRRPRRSTPSETGIIRSAVSKIPQAVEPEKPAREQYDLRQVFKPDGTPAELDDAAHAALRVSAELLFAASDDGKVRRADMIGRVAGQLEISPEDASKILQQLYVAKTIGKALIEGEDTGFFTLDPNLRRGRRKSGDSTANSTESAKKSRENDKTAIELGIDEILNALVYKSSIRRGGEAWAEPGHIAHFLSEKLGRRFTRDQVKQAVALVPSYVDRGLGQSKTYKVGINDKRVIEAWRQDAAGVLKAIHDKIPFEQYLESRNQT